MTIEIFISLLSLITAACSAFAARSANKIANKVLYENEKLEIILKPLNEDLIYKLPLEIENFLSNPTEEQLDKLNTFLLHFLELSIIFKFTCPKIYNSIFIQIKKIQDISINLPYNDPSSRSQMVVSLRHETTSLLEIFYKDLFHKL